MADWWRPWWISETTQPGDGDPDCDPGWYCTNVTAGGVWNPLTDDGDALRLAVALDLEVAGANGKTYVCGGGGVFFEQPWSVDKCAATRRAIVRAAAAIGGGLAPFPTAKEIRRDWGMESD